MGTKGLSDVKPKRWSPFFSQNNSRYEGNKERASGLPSKRITFNLSPFPNSNLKYLLYDLRLDDYCVSASSGIIIYNYSVLQGLNTSPGRNSWESLEAMFGA